MKRLSGWAVLGTAAFVATHARAQGYGPDAGTSVHGCVESVPSGAEKPTLMDSFPARGVSGWAAVLAVTVRHGKGERVLPSGLDLSSAAEARTLLKSSGFVIPDQAGGARARLWTDAETGERSTTHLEIPLLLLPETPGRSALVLPPVPVAVARANGEIATLCTHPHVVAVDDPTAQTPEARPRENPAPLPQREEWTALKQFVTYVGLGLLAGALFAYAAYRYAKRPRAPAPLPPPRPPWEIALEKLDEVRCAGLLESGRYTEYFDRVSDAVRGYLGSRFGFDGLESTTAEIVSALRHRQDLSDNRLGGVIEFLRECDLVKFANLIPTPAQCAGALTNGEGIVRSTMAGVSAPGQQTPPSEQPETPETPETRGVA